jgi:hypothetical protein
MTVHTRSGFRFLITLIAICCSLIVSLKIFGQANAQADAQITLKAEAGFDGYAKEGKWIPVHVTVENQGADVNEASLQVSYKDYSGTSTVYSADISLPTNSRKELFIYVYYPQSGPTSLNVELISGEKVITKITTRISNVEPQSLIIGLMTDTPSNYNRLSQITPQNGITRLVEIKPDNMPNMSQGWEALDAIVISDIDTGVLTSAQSKALELWVAKGGLLITVGGSKWQSTVQGIQHLLPIQISGTTNVNAEPEIIAFTSTFNFPGSAPFPLESESILATGKLTPDARVLVTQDNFPLVIEKEFGGGKIVFFAADPGLAPYQDWIGTFIIYDALLNFKHPQTAWGNGRWEIYSTNEAITTIQELSIPSIFLICGLLGFYIVLIGPLNYFFLRIIKKREWAWISIPAIVVIVTMTSYVYGYFYRGTTPTLNRLTVIQAWDGVDQTQSDTLVGIYSPQRDSYTLESEDGFLLYPYNTDDINLQGKTSWLSTQSGQGTNVPEIPIEIGGMKVIGTTGTGRPLKIEHNLTVNFDNGNARISGTITNNDTITITDLSLITTAKWKNIGDLAPGESAEVNLPLVTTANSPEFYYDNSNNYLQTGYPQLQKNEELRRKESFLRSVISPEQNENNSNWGIYLMGWLEDQKSLTTLKGFNAKNTDTTLYIHQVHPDISIPSSEYTLTAALLEWQSNSAEASPYYAYSYNSTDYILHFRPALPIQFSGVQQLKLHLDSYAPSTNVEVSLWDFTLNDWDTLGNVTWGSYNVADPEKYVSKAGEVLMRVQDAQSSGYIEMKRSAISLVVIP